MTAEVRPHDLADVAIDQVRTWLAKAAALRVDPAAAQLAGLLKDPDGLDFAVGFVDSVIRPEDARVAAHAMRALSGRVPAFLSPPLKAAMKVGGGAAPALPEVVVPLARRALRALVGHLIVDASDARLGKAVAAIRKPGIRLNANLLGEAILGRNEASRRLEGTRALLARDDIDYVSIKVSATVAPHNHWAFDEAVAHIVEQLLPLYRLAASTTPSTFINLDMEEYKDLDLTLAVFTRLLDRDEFHALPGGIVLQAYLPDALGAMQRLQAWASERVARGGVPVKVRVVKGANLPMERADAELRGWPAATWGSKLESDASYKAVLDYALRPERLASVRVGVAGHNLFDIALAWHLAKARGVVLRADDPRPPVEFEMLLGMAQAQAQAVLADVGSLLLYMPVVHPGEFDVAIAYLIRRLEEGASHDNFMSAVFELDSDAALFEREKRRFLASLAALDEPPFVDADGSAGVPGPNRVQDRRLDPTDPRHTGGRPDAVTATGFANTPDTDPDLPGNRAWGRAILQRAQASTLGLASSDAATIDDADRLDAVLATAREAGERWGALTGAQRAEVLDAAGRALEARRADLLEVMASECGKTLDQGDPEVSEAIDFAHYYAHLARRLDTVDGARFVPDAVTAVTPPWNFPVAIPAGSTLAALAAGSAVVIKPADLARRSGAVMVECLWQAFDETAGRTGVGREALQLLRVSERDLGRRFVAHRLVDRLILTGGHETARLFRTFRPDLPLLAETSGKNAIIVTPSADLDLAARDVAQSAFGHAGQKCSAASLVVLVGSVATSPRFRRQLLDAVTSLHVGYPWDARTQMGPIIAPPGDKLLRGLTQLGDGETWLLKPQRLDGSGTLWAPGVRDGVRRGSEYHLTEYFGPILGIMTADTLADAIAVVNEVDYGLTSGLHSLDADEIATWCQTIQAGNLYVNRGITGAIVQRQPFGGWKRSAIGPGAKAGGPNYLVGLGSWADAAPLASGVPAGAAGELLKAARVALEPADADWLARALGSDAVAWATEFGISQDVTGLRAERNVFRYRPVPVTVRYEAASSGHGIAELLRVCGAGLRAGSGLTVSTPVALPGGVADVLRAHGAVVVVEASDAWLARAARLGSGRVRLIASGPDAHAALIEATGGAVDIAAYAHPVTSAGRVEMLPFLHEQTVSLTAHRFGNPNPVTLGVAL